MHRAPILALASLISLGSTSFAQGLTPEHAQYTPPALALAPEPYDGLVDPDTSGCIFALVNDAKSSQEIVEKSGIEPDAAKLILDIRNSLKESKITTLDQLQPAWTAYPAAFAKLYCLCGPPTRGQWTTLPYEQPFSPVNTTLLKNGLVLFFEEANTTRTWMWDPSNLTTGIFIFPDNSPQSFLWCSQTVQLSDGRVLAAGGGGGSPAPTSDYAHIFDPSAGTNGVWTRINDMNFERWYPSVVALGGETVPGVLIVGGTQFGGGGTVGPMELYDEATGAFTIVPGASSELFWSPLYPGLHQLANGQIVFTRTGFSGNPPTPGTQFFQWNDFTNPTTGTWYNLGGLAFSERQEAMSFQFMEPTDSVYEQRSRILVVGGGQFPTTSSRTAEIIDAENLTIGAPWTRLPDMVEPRPHAQGVLLPDGKAIIWGGASHGNNGLVGSFSSELFDPCCNKFIRQDDLQYARGYHSGAALLPSGQVLATGGINGPLERTMEIYSPPYLFRGPRPVITSVPSLVHHGGVFDIVTPNAAEIDKVVLCRPVSNTHNTDSEQRVLQLKFTRNLATGTVRATMPNGTHPHPHAPRGYYLLFILNCDGVPSVGKFVWLH